MPEDGPDPEEAGSTQPPLDQEPTVVVPPADQPIGVPLPVPEDSAGTSRWRSWFPLGRVLGGIAIAVAIGLSGLLSNGGSNHTGPSATEVEQALVHSAAKHGVTVTVSCPDSVQDSAPGSDFTCKATNRHGDSLPVIVSNKRDAFAWPFAPFLELRRLEHRRGRG